MIRDERGSAILEMSIILPVIFALMAGGVDFSMAFSTHATIGKSARAAGRYLASLPSASACSSWAETNAQNIAVYGKIAPVSGVDNPLIGGWTPGQVSIDCSAFPTITVTAQATYNTVMLRSVGAYINTGSIGSITLSASHQETWIGS
jgi:Flp pilus assembly protein TadG